MPERNGDALLLSMAKAVRDSVQEAVDRRLQGTEKDLFVRLGKQIEARSAEADNKILPVLNDCQASVEDLKKCQEAQQDWIKEVQASLGGKLDSLTQSLDEKLTALHNTLAGVIATVERAFADKVKSLEKTYVDHAGVLDKSLADRSEAFVSFLKSLPAPNVNVSVPESAIKINQAPVNVTVPESAINVSVAPAKVELSQPKRKTTITKSILYNDKTGRPDKVVEETEEG